MKNTKNNKKKNIWIPIVGAVIAIGALAFAFFSGGSLSNSSDKDSSVDVAFENGGEDPENIPDGTVTISINCQKALDNLEVMDKSKHDILPEDGYILAPTEVDFTGGETVFDVMQEVTKENKIHFEYSNAPAYKTTYIEGIGNLYEFDGGDLSGWVYCVNGVRMGVGCSRCYVQDGDVVEFLYTLDLGEDAEPTYQAK